MSETRGLAAGAAGLILALLGVRLALSAAPTERSLSVLPDMVHTKAAKSLAACAVLPDGLVQQPVPAGVVTQQDEEFPFGPGTDEQTRAGVELRNPLPVDDAAALARGSRLFGIYCTPCHGQDGEGRGLAVVRGMLPPPPFKGARAMALPDGAVFHILTLGQNNMASYAAQLLPADRWCVIRHLRTLQKETR